MEGDYPERFTRECECPKHMDVVRRTPGEIDSDRVGDCRMGDPVG